MHIVEAVIVGVVALALLAWVIGRPHTMRKPSDGGYVSSDSPTTTTYDCGSSWTSNDAASNCDSDGDGVADSCDGGSDGGGGSD